MLADEEEQLKAAYLLNIQFLIVEMSRKQFFYQRFKTKWPKTDSVLLVSSKLISHGLVFVAAVTDIDTSGIHALEELHRSLQKRDIQVNALPDMWHD